MNGRRLRQSASTNPAAEKDARSRPLVLPDVDRISPGCAAWIPLNTPVVPRGRGEPGGVAAAMRTAMAFSCALRCCRLHMLWRTLPHNACARSSSGGGTPLQLLPKCISSCPPPPLPLSCAFLAHHTCRCTSAHCRTSLSISSSSRWSSRFSASVSRQRWSSL